MGSGLRCASALLLLLAIGACSDGFSPGHAPYGFDAEPRQSFRFEAHDQTDIDGVPVTVERGAGLVLEAEPAGDGRHELVVYLDRYVSRVEGIPGGSSEFTLSADGLSTRGPADPEPLVLGPDDPAPGGGRIGDVVSKPLGGWLVQADGALEGTPWRSQQPLFGGIRVVDWLLLSLPVLPGSERSEWSGRRPLPALGQYVLGVEMPIEYQRVPSDGLALARIRSNGFLTRQGLELAVGFRGALQIEHLGEADLDELGRVVEARVELRVRFEAESGSVVQSRHNTRLRCLSCANRINPVPEASDTEEHDGRFSP